MLLAVASPITMMVPISDGTLKVVCVTNNAQRTPNSAPGSAMMMISGSVQD